MNIVSARAAALRILAARRGPAGDARPSLLYALPEFQQEAVTRAGVIMQQRGGVIIADSVGLGKTYVAAGLIERYLPGRCAIAVIVPASLRPAWRRALRPLLDSCRDQIQLITHGQLSRGTDPGHGFGLVVVDEAHAFRNPRTRRYRALRRLAAGAQVALLTATPVNNSLADLYFQIRICAADDAFADLGIGSISALLRAEPIDPAALARLRDALIVRRTRAELRDRSCLSLPGGQLLRFPQTVELIRIEHPPVLGMGAVDRLLTRIRFAAYRNDTTATLIALSLLKRLQSGRHAALRSLDRQLDFHERFLAALREGRLLQTRALPGHDEQLSFSEILLPALPPDIDPAALSRAVRSDLHDLRELRDAVAARSDPKLPALIELLTARPPPAHTLVFTEFRDTARELWRTLRSRFQVGLVTGMEAHLGEHRCSRADVIRRFAPHANHAAEPAAAEAVFVLIATDVLAEGLNLQDADAVVSYDLPWNPVRLIQRAGRVDRLGSHYDRVLVYNFMPDHEFDRVFGLLRRLRGKLRKLRASVGHDSPVLDPDELAAAFRAEWYHERERLLSIETADAAPEGSIGSTTENPHRILVCWRSGATIRELTIQAGRILDDKRAADDILERALDSSAMIAPPALPAAAAASRAYLPSPGLSSAGDREAVMLARAIQRAIQAYGVLASPDLLALADRVLAGLPRNVYEPAQLAAVRAAASPQELQEVLGRLLPVLDNVGPAAAEWVLVAAIGAD